MLGLITPAHHVRRVTVEVRGGQRAVLERSELATAALKLNRFGQWRFRHWRVVNGKRVMVHNLRDVAAIEITRGE